MTEARTAEQLPNDIQTLKDMVINLHRDLASLKRELELKTSHFNTLAELHFGSKSEKKPYSDPNQQSLFDEAEYESGQEDKKEETQEVKGHQRKKPGGRKPLSDDIPRRDVVLDIAEELKICGCGLPLNKIGEEISEQLNVIPAVVEVIRTIRPKYACHHCEGSQNGDKPAIQIANMPPRILGPVIVTEGLLAHIVTGKFCDSLPLYRQEKIFSRMGAEISRKNMANWMIGLDRVLEPLKKIFWDHLRSGPLINADETTVQVLGEKERSNKSKSYMWVFKGGPPGKKIVLFHYEPTRSPEFLKSKLSGYQAAVQTDGYVGYKYLEKQEGVLHLGCWVHVRRKFVQAEKSSSNKASAKMVLSFIAKLYKEEKLYRNRLKEGAVTETDFLELREAAVTPILDDLKSCLEKMSHQVHPSTPLGEAISYTLNQWDPLVNYLKVADATPDNNPVENAIRPFVIGRKNWCFSGSPRGASASAFLYTLVESAKANGLEPYFYLRYLFTTYPTCPADELDRILPWNLEPEDLLLKN